MSDTEHIVIVDDEADVRDTLGEYLGNQGFRVTALDSGVELRQLVCLLYTSPSPRDS